MSAHNINTLAGLIRSSAVAQVATLTAGKVSLHELT